MGNQNFGGWTVRYGKGTWHEAESGLTEQEAHGKFNNYRVQAPRNGNLIAEYLLLEDDQGKTVESCIPGYN